MKKLFIPLVVLALGFNSLNAQDWPQFNGPNRNGTSEQKGILRAWPQNGPEVLWTANVGIGYGGPVVKDGKVYILDRNDEVGDMMRCFDLNTGKELWNYAYNAPGSVMFPGSRSVPAVDDNYVYSCGPYGDLYCIDINTHQPVWNKNIWKDFGEGTFPSWAISQCPLIYGDLLIVASQATNAGVVAYNKKTGELKWQTPSLGATGYVSPTIVKIDGADHLVMITASDQRAGKMGNVVGMEPLTGNILWQFSNWDCHIPVPSAVDAGNNKLLIVGGYELGALMIQVTKSGSGAYTVNELYRTEEFGDQTKPPILYNGYFYAQYGTNNRRDGLACMSIDGEIMWKTKRDPDFNKGSMILAEGLLLATDGSKSLYLIQPDPSGFKPLASAAVLAEGGTGSENDPLASRVGGATQNWGAIALADGRLLIRDQGRLLCLKIAQ